MRKFLLASAACLFLVNGTSYADVMAQGKITRLDSSTSAANTFVMQIDGAGGYVCNGNPQTIGLGNFPDADSYKRFFALAMLAFTQGNTVVVYNNPAAASCNYLAVISILTQ